MIKRDAIADNLPELRKQSQAQLSILVVEALAKKGFKFETAEEMEVMFKERIKGNVHGNLTTLKIDGIEFCSYKPPVFKYIGRSKKKISIKQEFLEL